MATKTARRRGRKPSKRLNLSKGSQPLSERQLTPSRSLRAKRVVKILRERGRQYGDVGSSFSGIAKMWGAYLDLDLSASDVAMMMLLLKVSRAKRGKVSTDTVDDIIGYCMLYGEMKGV